MIDIVGMHRLLLQSFGQSDKWHVTVAVEYDGESSFATQIRSYISRELRALGDVDETDKDPKLQNYYFLDWDP